jgi:uncharacterized protein (UPF0548 family)
VISLRRPTLEQVEAYRQARIDAEPTASSHDDPGPGFHHNEYARTIGSGSDQFRLAREGLERWAAHRGSGVEVFPSDAGLVPGDTVAILTRQLGLWVLAACRVETVVDEPNRFGFVYATLPDHPERGYEWFVVQRAGDDVVFTIEAVSQPGIALVRLGSPVTRVLQRRAVDAYLTALATSIEDPQTPT